MILTLQPTRSYARPAGNSPQPLGRSSHIFHVKGRKHHWQGIGSLSIKSFFNGQAFYDVGAGRYRVDDSCYLVLNQGQRYSIAIESAAPVESFCLFFEDGFVEEVHRSLLSDTEHLLDEPQAPGGPPIDFFERTYPHDRLLSPALFRLRALLPRRKTKSGSKSSFTGFWSACSGFTGECVVK